MEYLKAFKYRNIDGWLLNEDEILNKEPIFRSPADLLKNPSKVFKKEENKITLLAEPSAINSEIAVDPWLIKKENVRSQFIKKHFIKRKNKKIMMLVNELASQGIPVPRIYAFLCEKGRPDSYYQITEGLIDGENLALIQRNQKDWFSSLVNDGLIGRLVETLADIHRHGYVHSDMKWSNIVVLKNGEFRFVDLDNVKKPVAAKGEHLFLKDLARFLIGAQEAGLGEDALEDIVEKYSTCLSLDLDGVIRKLKPHINKLSRRKKIPVAGFLT